MTTKEQISAKGAQLFVKEKVLDKYLQKKDIQTFERSADTLHQEALNLVEAYPDYIHSYVVYIHVVSSISEKYSSLQNKNGSARAVELLALSMMKLTEFVYPDKLKYESAANLCITNAMRLCGAIGHFSYEHNDAYRDLLVIAIRVLCSLYNKVLAFNPDIAILKDASVLLQDIHVDIASSQYALSKDLLVKSCDTIYSSAIAAVLLNKNDSKVRAHAEEDFRENVGMTSHSPATAPAKTSSSSVSVPTPTKVTPPRNNTPSYSSSSSYRKSLWSRVKDMIEDLNDKIEDLGRWFYYNAYEAGEIGSNILVGGIIIFCVIGVISVWANEGLGIAILAAIIGCIVCAVFMGVGKFVLELCVVGIMHIFRYLFYNAWTLLAIIVVAVIITLSVLASGNIPPSDNSAESQEYVAPVTHTYCCTASTVLNVRSAPAGNARVIGTLKSGQYIQVYNIVDGYAKFEYGDGYGYANTTYLKKIE